MTRDAADTYESAAAVVVAPAPPPRSRVNSVARPQAPGAREGTRSTRGIAPAKKMDKSGSTGLANIEKLVTTIAHFSASATITASNERWIGASIHLLSNRNKKNRKIVWFQ